MFTSCVFKAVTGKNSNVSQLTSTALFGLLATLVIPVAGYTDAILKSCTDCYSQDDFSENISDYNRSNTCFHKYSSDRQPIRLDDKLTSSLSYWS
ncbi:hypothetical protein Npun_R4012 [Nostoc punctiforme PCC 73102]|uniref:Uncharacterized protein n=1 Tax=Nostoc punctiforme (strain ATCC 29133 / PCC 73102) TaxID=63737 RepID=B2J6I6_NOSP7|nr:hypothetical protein Npun_R4012 [Nostoc punctiforme PCC 73102]